MCLRCSVFAGPSWFHHHQAGVEILAQDDAGFLDDVEPLGAVPFELVVTSSAPPGKVNKVGGRASRPSF
jgi:hypothetical protein